LPERRFEFIPFWGFLVFSLYAPAASAVPRLRRGGGEASLERRQAPFHPSAHAVSGPLGAQAFLEGSGRERSTQSWDRVHDAVEYVVQWGLEHRTLESIYAIGVDEIQYAKGHKYLTLVYQIDREFIRLLWVGKERTIESFRGFFTGHRREGGFRDSVRLLGYVAALPGRDRPEVFNWPCISWTASTSWPK
jgi:transposase